MVKTYIPDRGDIAIMSLDPQAGHEQKGRRPVLVISNKTFNNFTKGAIICPITNNTNPHPFHVAMSAKNSITGVVKCEQLKSVDYNARQIKFVEKIDKKILDEILDIVIGFIE